MIHKITILLSLLISIAFVYILQIPAQQVSQNVPIKTIRKNDSTEIRLHQHINEAQHFIQTHQNYNSEIVFLIDMRIPSNLNRFYVYNLKKKKIVDKGIVAHGCGSESETYGQLIFSNIENSLCTSLGKYAIGQSYQGQFGKAYKLHGLESSNDNAFNRHIVLHEYDKVPFKEQQTPICTSYGCPMVNAEFFKQLEKRIDQSDLSILMDIYY